MLFRAQILILFYFYKLQAENRIVQKFPERIVHLNELLRKPEFRIAEMDLKCTLDIPSLKLENNVNK